MADGTTASSRKKALRKQPDLSIVIPAYKEEKRIGKTLEYLSHFVRKNDFIGSGKVEIIVVAATSSDKTVQIANSKSHRFNNFRVLIPGTKVGKGRDVQYGMLRAKGRIVLFMDADLATPLHHIRDFYQDCETGIDIVVGTRNMLKHHPKKLRRGISRIGNVLFRVSGGLWIEDSQCGFKMFTQEASNLCFSKLTIMGWGFDMEVLTVAKVNNLTIKTRRIEDWKDIPDGTFNDNLLKNSVFSLLSLTKILINRVKRTYRHQSSSS